MLFIRELFQVAPLQNFNTRSPLLQLKRSLLEPAIPIGNFLFPGAWIPDGEAPDMLRNCDIVGEHRRVRVVSDRHGPTGCGQPKNRDQENREESLVGYADTHDAIVEAGDGRPLSYRRVEPSSE
jgi:hypothetical protein